MQSFLISVGILFFHVAQLMIGVDVRGRAYELSWLGHFDFEVRNAVRSRSLHSQTLLIVSHYALFLPLRRLQAIHLNTMESEKVWNCSPIRINCNS